jgi:hypothetical protein
MPARRNYGWIWFFAIVAVLTATSLTILIRYNLGQQLSTEKLAEARALWEQKGPANYDLEYTQTGSVSETRKVRVRNHKVVWAVRDGEPLEPRLYPFSDMNAWFGFLEDYLQEDSQPGKPRVFSVATFSADDGHILRYIRRIMGTPKRLEVVFDLKPVQTITPSQDTSAR